MYKVLSLLLFAQIILCCYRGNAQNYPVYNSYYMNPYLYNPAEVATEYTYIFLNHRQQWTGIEGSPSLTTANFNTLLNESKAGIGAKISSYKRGILNSTDITLTYAYGVHVSRKDVLFFGLSGGAITNSIDLTKADPNDPAIQNYLANNFQPVANFGMLYRSASGLNFGVVLPQLFAPKFNSSASFENTNVTPLDNVIVTAYYRKKVEGKIVSRTKKGVRSKVKTGEGFAPLEFYTMYKFAKAGNSQFEVMAKLNLSQNFWLGAGYRQAYGFTSSLGFAFNKFLLGYSFELGGQPEPGFSQGTHELQLGLKLGEPKKFKREAPVLRSTLKSSAYQHVARFQQSIEDPDQIATDQTKAKKKFYVVIKVFADFNAADAFKRKLIEQKFNANIFYYENDKKYHVHVLETSKQSEAYEEVRNLKNYTKLKEAHVLATTPK
ncbi:MAG: PorP/SprF family type IX secretion system membrane protein [Cyclobacteriaceae bacterium]|nr:PorP/SprF family type IX secretion system membrane protein [Cyclobacteriaceae bacterium]